MPLGNEIASLGLFTDLYQLTMAQAYWDEAQRNGTTDKTTSFQLYFRQNPFEGGYAVSCGLDDAIEYVSKFNFDEKSLNFLRKQKDSEGNPLFQEAFLSYLKHLKFSCDMEGMPDGTVVFPNQPMLRVTGPNIQAQLVETALLNIMNFQTLIATKAARVKYASNGKPVADFGLRRAQEEGAIAASKAAYIGGSDSTSNTLAAMFYDIPVKGTHAHAWIMSHDDELTAFREYAKSMPGNCIFLVDTYDSIQGAKNAIIVANELRQQGHEMLGIRLDSGDLAHLSKQIRVMLDEAGFPNAKIVASNDLDEHKIASLEAQGARIDIYGVGTQLLTAGKQPALGGVYKLGAIEHVNLVEKEDGRVEPVTTWERKIKLSGNAEKTTTPGRHQVRRFYSTVADEQTGEMRKQFVGDALYDIDTNVPTHIKIVHPGDPTNTSVVEMPENMPYEELLVPVYRGGELVYEMPSVQASKARAQEQLAALDPRTKRLLNPEWYLAGLEETLSNIKMEMIRTVKSAINALQTPVVIPPAPSSNGTERSPVINRPFFAAATAMINDGNTPAATNSSAANSVTFSSK